MSWLDTFETIRKTDFTKSTLEERQKAAREVINISSYACAMLNVSPVPFSDVALSLPLQTAMVVTLSHIYGKALSSRRARELALELIAATGASLLARQGIKTLLPIVGAVLTIPAAFAANWALGRVAMVYFESDGLLEKSLNKKAIAAQFAAARKEGARLFSLSRFLVFKRKNGAVASPQKTVEHAQAAKPKTAAKKRKVRAKKASAQV
jgi:uncharacterized protein (DUF697 family)